MCFTTKNKRAGTRPWKQTEAWKVLRWMPGGELHSEFTRGKKTTWTPGRTKVAKGRPFRQAQSAHAGIYVFHTRNQAVDYSRGEFYDHNHGHPKVVRVLVNPKDFLHESTYNDRATYRKVRLDPRTSTRKPRNRRA